MSITIHPTAIVDEGAQLGDGTHVWHWVHISSGAKIGERCSFGQKIPGWSLLCSATGLLR